jgi:hypothetical protein
MHPILDRIAAGFILIGWVSLVGVSVFLAILAAIFVTAIWSLVMILAVLISPFAARKNMEKNADALRPVSSGPSSSGQSNVHNDAGHASSIEGEFRASGPESSECDGIGAPDDGPHRPKIRRKASSPRKSLRENGQVSISRRSFQNGYWRH